MLTKTPIRRLFARGIATLQHFFMDNIVWMVGLRFKPQISKFKSSKRSKKCKATFKGVSKLYLKQFPTFLPWCWKTWGSHWHSQLTKVDGARTAIGGRSPFLAPSLAASCAADRPKTRQRINIGDILILMSTLELCSQSTRLTVQKKRSTKTSPLCFFGVASDGTP